MKRRVGAILVRNKRIVATGYVHSPSLFIITSPFVLVTMGRRSVLRTVMKAGVRAATVWKNAKVAYVYTLKKTRYWRLDGSGSVGLLCIATRQRNVLLHFYKLLSEITDVHVLPVL